jgi:hypothetical protein
MNSYYAPQNGYYPNHYAPAPQLQYAPMPVVQQTSGSGMKVVAGALALLAIGIAAFAVVFGMKNDSGMESTSAQSAPSTVINLPSEINIPSLGSSTAPAPVVVNNPAPRVITVPGEAPVQNQAPVQLPAQSNTDAQAQADADAKAAAATKAANAQKAADLKKQAADLHAQAAQQRTNASLLSPDKEAVKNAVAQADALDAEATSLEAQAAALGG